jgi:hypothetical protein
MQSGGAQRHEAGSSAFDADFAKIFSKTDGADVDQLG